MSAQERVKSDLSAANQSSLKDYVVRFAFGGIISSVICIVGKVFGPVVAGLFLAFPAILPASLTLVAEHSREQVAGIVALGAALGSIGLLAYALVIWLTAANFPGGIVLVNAFLVWVIVSVGVWEGYEQARQRNPAIDRLSEKGIESNTQRWGVAKR